MGIVIQTTDEVRAVTEPATQWVRQGFLASGAITLFTSRWKTGKTTLLAFLLSQREAGGELAGAAVSPGTSVVVTEEPLRLWLERSDRLKFGPQVQWCCRPFATRPSLVEWESLILELAARKPGLVVIDPLAMVLPADVENNATSLLRVLDPVRVLTESGAAVLILHHPRKGSSPGDLNPRGSGALAGVVDFLMQLEPLQGAGLSDRRRRLRCASRMVESHGCVLELSADGREYKPVRETEPDTFEQGWTLMKTIFEESSECLTRQNVHKYWPPDYEKPSISTVTRWLERALRENRLERRGKGTYHEPFHYALPGFRHAAEDFERLPGMDEMRKHLFARMRPNAQRV